MQSDPADRLLADARLIEADDQISRLQATLDHLLEGVVVCDEEGRTIYRNEAANEFVGSRFGGAVAASAIEGCLSTARRGRRDEKLLELFSPSRRMLSIRAFPLRAEREVEIGAVAIVEDVSDRQRVDAMRRDFVANVSHELKTPVGALSLLAETLDGEDDLEVVSRLSSRLSTEADRLARIIDDLLDLSRIEANEAPTLEVVGASVILGQAVEGLRPMAEAGRIELVVDEGGVGLDLCCDQWEVVSAVANLVDNAIKYSEPGGRVTISVRPSSDPVDGIDMVEITVADRGIGIPKGDLERIFERFYRVDRARSRTTGGTGLGLSIVRHVVANHHGTVRVESSEGAGSRFTLVLPRVVGCADPAEGARTEPVGQPEAPGA